METPYVEEDVPGGVPIKMWTRGVPVEDAAKRQLTNAARLPVIFKHIAAMPDVHFGIGATVGSVIPTLKAIIPAAVGVDIGCVMMAARLSLTEKDLDEKTLTKVFNQISRDVPVGFQQHDDPVSDVVKPFGKKLSSILQKHPGVQKRIGKHSDWTRQLGTLGGGNHFIEVCLDET